MCEAAWELSNFVPSSLEANPQRIGLWKNMLIPKVFALLGCFSPFLSIFSFEEKLCLFIHQITQALVDDVLARNAMERSFSSIVTLANSINQSAGLVRSTRGT